MAKVKSKRQELITDIRNILGDGMVDVELDPKHYEQGIDLAVDRYRQKSGNSTEEAYIFLQLQQDVNEYTLAKEVIEVKEIYRRSVAGSLGTVLQIRNLHLRIGPHFGVV